MTEPLLTARVVAERFAVSPETVLRWTRRGDLEAVRLPGGQLRYRPDALERWLANRTTGPAPEGEVSPTPSAAPALGVLYGPSPTPLEGGEEE